MDRKIFFAIAFSTLFAFSAFTFSAAADPHRPNTGNDRLVNDVVRATFGGTGTLSEQEGFVVGGQRNSTLNEGIIQFISTEGSPAQARNLLTTVEAIVQLDVSAAGDKMLAVAPNGIVIVDLTNPVIESTLLYDDHFASLASSPLIGGVFGNDNEHVLLFFADTETTRAPERLVVFNLNSLTKVSELVFSEAEGIEAGFEKIRTNSAHTEFFVTLSGLNPAHKVTKYSLTGSTISEVGSVNLPDLHVPGTVIPNSDGSEIATIEWNLTEEENAVDEKILTNIHFYTTNGTFDLNQTIEEIEATHISGSFDSANSDNFWVGSMNATETDSYLYRYDRTSETGPAETFRFLGYAGGVAFPAPGALIQNTKGEFLTCDGAIANASSVQVVRTEIESDCWNNFFCHGLQITNCGFIEEGDTGRTIKGTSGVDVLAGGITDDTILGYGGDDHLCGNAGLDFISGGGGNDYIDGGPAKDTLNGQSGNDIILARGGNDLIRAGSGDDIVRGHGGNDVIYGQNGEDDLNGGGGNDLIRGGAQADIIRGANGNDRLFGDGQNDKIFGNDGNDVLVGGSDDDRAYGGPGDDFLVGSTGDDFLSGNAGIDRAIGGSGVDNCIAESEHGSCET